MIGGLIAITFILTTGGVILLRPLSKRLGDLLEAMALERRNPRLREEVLRMHDLVENLNARLALMEERQDFTDSLLRSSDRARLEPPRRAVDEPPLGGDR